MLPYLNTTTRDLEWATCQNAIMTAMAYQTTFQSAHLVNMYNIHNNIMVYNYAY